MSRSVLSLILISTVLKVFAWNALGHQLIAQIAYDNLSPKAKYMCAKYLNSDENHVESEFVAASTWLDSIRKKNIHEFDALHYIDIPFSNDKTHLPALKSRNALSAIKQAVLVLLSNRATSTQKKLNLRILIHVIGDIHQPMHTATKISRRLPSGDKGGGLFLLSKNPISRNLHGYWDNGGGFLNPNKRHYSFANSVYQLEKKWPCSLANQQSKPEQWVLSSHYIALTQAYTLKTHRKPSKKYQQRVKDSSEKQIVFAGCRLAMTLNNIASKL